MLARRKVLLSRLRPLPLDVGRRPSVRCPPLLLLVVLAHELLHIEVHEVVLVLAPAVDHLDDLGLPGREKRGSSVHHVARDQHVRPRGLRQAGDDARDGGSPPITPPMVEGHPAEDLADGLVAPPTPRRGVLHDVGPRRHVSPHPLTERRGALPPGRVRETLPVTIVPRGRRRRRRRCRRHGRRPPLRSPPPRLRARLSIEKTRLARCQIDQHFINISGASKSRAP